MKHPKCPHTEEIVRTKNGATLAVTQPYGYRIVPYRVGTTAQVLDYKKRHSVCGVSLVLTV